MTDERAIELNLKRVERALVAKGFAAVADSSTRSIAVLRPKASIHDLDDLWDRTARPYVIKLSEDELLAPGHVEVALRQAVAHFGH